VSTKRLWLIAGAAVAAVAVVILPAMIVSTQASEAEPTPSATAASPSPTQSPSATPTPTPTPSPTAEQAEVTCDDIATAVFLEKMASNGWVSWQTQDQAIGARPFEDFPNGSPPGAIVCRWGAGPEVATDNIIDLAWTPIDPENAVAAMQKLADQGYVRTDAPDGVYLSLTGPEGYTDAQGWGETYYFTAYDVRWAATRADVDAYVKAPTESD